MTKPASATSQLTLSLFDSTALSGGFTLDGGGVGSTGLRYREPEFEDEDQEQLGTVDLAAVRLAGCG